MLVHPIEGWGQERQADRQIDTVSWPAFRCYPCRDLRHHCLVDKRFPQYTLSKLLVHRIREYSNNTLFSATKFWGSMWCLSRSLQYSQPLQACTWSHNSLGSMLLHKPYSDLVITWQFHVLKVGERHKSSITCLYLSPLLFFTQIWNLTWNVLSVVFWCLGQIFPNNMWLQK